MYDLSCACQEVCQHLPEHIGWGGEEGRKLLIQITFFDDFWLCMSLGCKCDVLECTECKCPSFETFWGYMASLSQECIGWMSHLKLKKKIIEFLSHLTLSIDRWQKIKYIGCPHPAIYINDIDLILLTETIRVHSIKYKTLWLNYAIPPTFSASSKLLLP